MCPRLSQSTSWFSAFVANIFRPACSVFAAQLVDKSIDNLMHVESKVPELCPSDKSNFLLNKKGKRKRYFRVAILSPAHTPVTLVEPFPESFHLIPFDNFFSLVGTVILISVLPPSVLLSWCELPAPGVQSLPFGRAAESVSKIHTINQLRC